MKVLVASDHAGFELKAALVPFLKLIGHDAEDMGPLEFSAEDDYPDFILPLARRVADEGAMGVIIGGSGQGEAIAANRVSGVRACVYYGGPLDVVLRMREHNDANVLSLGSRFITGAEAQAAVRAFFDTMFSGDERHVRRIHKLDSMI